MTCPGPMRGHAGGRPCRHQETRIAAPSTEEVTDLVMSGGRGTHGCSVPVNAVPRASSPPEGGGT